MKQANAKDARVCKKIDKQKVFSFNVVVKCDNNVERKVRYSPEAVATLTNKSLVQMPNVQNGHNGVIDIECEEVAICEMSSDDNL